MLHSLVSVSAWAQTSSIGRALVFRRGLLALVLLNSDSDESQIKWIFAVKPTCKCLYVQLTLVTLRLDLDLDFFICWEDSWNGTILEYDSTCLWLLHSGSFTWSWVESAWRPLRWRCAAGRREQPRLCTCLQSAGGLNSPCLSSQPALFPELNIQRK